MTARVAAVATAVPEHVVTQEEAREFARGFFARDFTDLDRLLDAFDNTGIRKRHLARPVDWYWHPRTFPEKNVVYRETALDLGEAAARRALDASGLAPEDIGAILFVSTTGVATPSLDSHLIQRLGLRRTTKRLPIWGLGCAGGAAGLARAANLTTGLDAPTLLVAVEVCSTTFVHGDRSKSNLIATALFADGAAAVVLTPGGTGAEIIGTHSHLVEDSEDVMGWAVGAEGLQVIFSRSIPAIVRGLAAQIAQEASAGAGISPDALAHFVFHPGGARVLDAYKETFGLANGQLGHAESVLRDFGNMSSPSVLFVLERFLASHAPAGAPTLLMALGPGFSAESVVLRW